MTKYEKFYYRSEIVALTRAYDHLQDACKEAHEALAGTWGNEMADKTIEQFYEKVSACDDLLEKWMGQIAFSGLCYERERR